MEKKILKYTIEQINNCGSNISMNLDIRRLEDHIAVMDNVHFPHRHDFYNLLYITQGSGTHDIDFKRFEVVPNTLFFMNDTQIHEWNLSDDIQGFTLFFKKEFYNVAEPMFSLPNLPFFHNSQNEAQMVFFEENEAMVINHFFEDMLNEFNKRLDNHEAIIKTLLKIILIRSLRVYQPNFSSSGSSLILSKIRQFESLIETKHSKLKSVREYASIMNMTPNYLNAICSNTLGKTAGEMIRERIILEAKRLLIHTPLSICEMGYNLGYEDCSYFIRVFKKAVGQTPEQFRLKLT
ncbi:helix-turn-helix domain-containing protein [Lacihabitans sp. LS3-19]|uniref:helix-turn-helix domain-containing protein n=1 Tax=Lacihabitans sp. LS3-19 TaxID=2487335 RepID=UPI0020CD4CBD|nr:AraC family transcriptional regulator [Lacihabitans sp. LS3-19]MCP9768578.1 helix-turn-helix domain-containing protein [Lacihabitans sp. LS3-19]